MEKLEVDPRLFITCRLCLDEMGQYQIVPKVKTQIKYCFDIEVDPFDGLPQLICRNCESILSQYVVIKQRFQEKQNTLSLKTHVNNVDFKTEDDKETNLKKESEVLPQEAVTSTSSQQNEDINIHSIDSDEDNPPLTRSTSTDAEVDNNNSDVDRDEEREAPKTLMVRIKTWKADFKKYFVCRFCSKKHVEKRNIIRHIKKHNKLLSCYNKKISKFCSVRLEKFDHLPNITGSKKMVAHLKNFILQNKNANYYVMYLLKSTKKNSEMEDSYSSSESEIMPYNQKRKRRRINSRSSSDTVKIENNRVRNEINDDPIELSDTETVVSKNKDEDEEEPQVETNIVSPPNKKEKVDVYTIVKNIIEMSCQRFLRKLENSEDKSSKTKNKESQLKHKVLSIGSKLINSKEFNCVGILRYLEYKNLDVNCLPRVVNKLSLKDNKHVRIRTRLKEKNDNNNKNNGWLNISSVMGDDYMTQDFSSILKNILVPDPTNKVENSVLYSYLKQDQAVISKSTVSDLDKQTKLLNENPVANPKQLPKKTNITETQMSNTENMEVEDNSHLPIITSAMSLAPDVKQISAQPNPIFEIAEKPKVPRIKVKSNDVLMANNNTNSMYLLSGAPADPTVPVSSNNWHHLQNISQNTTGFPQYSDIPSSSKQNSLHFTKIAPKPLQPIQILNNNVHQSPSSVNLNIQPVQNDTTQYLKPPPPVPSNILQPIQVYSGNSQQYSQTAISSKSNPLLSSQLSSISQDPPSLDRSFVVLDTIDFPNTKTESPFSYFEQLLLLHNITLLSNHERHEQLKLLVKFKLLLQQEPSLSITISVALYGDIQKFVFEVTDDNNRKIEVTKLNSNWQWEILKAFAGNDVVQKLFSNAQKAGHAMFEKSKHFIYFLRSIKLVVAGQSV